MSWLDPGDATISRGDKTAVGEGTEGQARAALSHHTLQTQTGTQYCIIEEVQMATPAQLCSLSPGSVMLLLLDKPATPASSAELPAWRPLLSSRGHALDPDLSRTPPPDPGPVSWARQGSQPLLSVRTLGSRTAISTAPSSAWCCTLEVPTNVHCDPRGVQMPSESFCRLSKFPLIHDSPACGPGLPNLSPASLLPKQESRQLLAMGVWNHPEPPSLSKFSGDNVSKKC